MNFYFIKKIKIGILHLCGGRNNEKTLHSTNTKNMRKIKAEQIEKIINKDTDIILGDFNSDIVHYLTNIINKEQQKYFINYKLTNHYKMNIWNKLPFKLLEDANYKLACGDKDACINFYKENKTSYFGPSPDVIFYKNNPEINVSKFNIINLLSIPQLSDHNGLFVDFNIKI